MPLARRIPKRGFSNFRFAKNYQIVNLRDLESTFSDGAVVDFDALLEAGLVRKAGEPVKILATGDLGKALTVKAAKFSASAAAKIEAAGGKAEVI
jgi:large subunit ribosomal protein L15